jgi:hypothetical protein
MRLQRYRLAGRVNARRGTAVAYNKKVTYVSQHVVKRHAANRVSVTLTCFGRFCDDWRMFCFSTLDDKWHSIPINREGQRRRTTWNDNRKGLGS